jgi:uncharacterized protein YuzE
MKITYDPKVDALYVKFTTHPVTSSRQLNPDVAVDLDTDGGVVGIEILNARQNDIDPLSLEFKRFEPQAG